MPEPGYTVVDDRVGFEQLAGAAPHWPAYNLMKVGDRWRQDKQIHRSVWGYLITRRADGVAYVAKVAQPSTTEGGVSLGQVVDLAKLEIEERMKKP